MAVLVHYMGADWTPELYRAVFEKVIPDRAYHPVGLIAHFAGPRPRGGWQAVEVWESEDAYRTFADGDLLPATRSLGAPPFEVTVSEVHNSLIP
ncbi:hypothetical protein ACWCP6_21310 [Streptomyces sp. NPDC002004]